jgi:hypothetical protein
MNMSLVNFLKFSNDSGAIISDEEYWNVFFRKRMHGDNLHGLLSPEQSETLGMEVVYGGVGYPAVHRDVIENAGQMVQDTIDKKSITAIQRVKDVARIAFDCLQVAIRQRIDQKLKFYYGFQTHDLNACSFRVNDETYPIESTLVMDSARKLASRETRDTLLKAAMDAKAAVFGYDKDGITGYYLSGENSIMGYVHEGFEAIGTGKYASGLLFGQDFKAKTLKMRQDGYEPAEGLYTLIDSAFLAGEHFKEVGGNYNIVLLNRAAGNPSDRYRQIFDDKARLATEIVRTVRSGYIKKMQAIELIHELIFQDKPFNATEKKLFQLAENKEALTFILRGYKQNEVATMFSDCKKETIIGKGDQS